MTNDFRPNAKVIFVPEDGDYTATLSNWDSQKWVDTVRRYVDLPNRQLLPVTGRENFQNPQMVILWSEGDCLQDALDSVIWAAEEGLITIRDFLGCHVRDLLQLPDCDGARAWHGLERAALTLIARADELYVEWLNARAFDDPNRVIPADLAMLAASLAGHLGSVTEAVEKTITHALAMYGNYFGKYLDFPLKDWVYKPIEYEQVAGNFQTYLFTGQKPFE